MGRVHRRRSHTQRAVEPDDYNSRNPQPSCMSLCRLARLPLSGPTRLLRSQAGSSVSIGPPRIFLTNQRVSRLMSTIQAADYFCVHVFVKTKPGTEDAFKEATLKNARNSAKEPGVARFDVLQDNEDPCQFVLVEVYKDKDKAPAAHKETKHYLEWREAVADMMAEPRHARKFTNHFPKTVSGWEYPTASPLE